MPSFSIALAQAEDAGDILALQDLNHVSNLSDDVLASGFVTTQLTPETLAKMQLHQCIWVARAENGALVAYACAFAWGFFGYGSFQNAAAALLPLHYDGELVDSNNAFQYGPVCVAHGFRGQGVLEPLVEAIKKHYAPRFPFGITFIDIRNLRSLAAHKRKVGFRPLALLPFGDVTYHMLAFSTR